MATENRVVVLIDMDCFYCQVEEKLNPELEGKPIAVVQYNPWKGGGIIAVNYVARAQGVTRHMRGDEAKEKCPDIELPSVPCLRGKADISKYREAGKQVARVLQKFTTLLERASIDEAYLDITQPVQDRLKAINLNDITTDLLPNTFALGYNNITDFIDDVQNYGSECIDFDHDNAKMLLVGAAIVSEIRAAVYDETGYRCSAGISHNKILAKLVCGMNKPNKQTVLPKHSINILYKTLGVKKVKHLGGKFGDNVCDILKISKMGELHNFTEKELQTKFDEKNGTWLYNIAHGIDLEPVQARFNPKSIGCCKQFKGKNALLDLESLKKWLKDLGAEIEDRLEKDALENNRSPKQMVVSFSMQLADGRDTSSSRSYNFGADDDLCGLMFSSKALELVMDSIENVKPEEGEPNRKLQMPIKFLGISVGKFEDNSEIKKTKKIMDYFSAESSKDKTDHKNNEVNYNKLELNDKNEKKKSEKEFIMQKFLQASVKAEVQEKAIPIIVENKSNSIIESSLDKQESFFAKFLNKSRGECSKQNITNMAGEETRTITPVCEVLQCGDDSNDTDHSSSTINNEINKSIALFEEDPQDVVRVSSMRTLLTITHQEPTDDPKIVLPVQEKSSKTPTNLVETFECPECKKVLPLDTFEIHGDYHLALKLRYEERQHIRKERERILQTPVVKSVIGKVQESKVKKVEESKVEANPSVADYFTKINDNVPKERCSECGKSIPIETLTEHLDFHEAQKLNRELNKRPVLNNYDSCSVKRKRKTISPVKKPKLPCKTIDSFFNR